LDHFRTLIVVMIRMRLFGYHEFSLLRRAALGRLAALGRVFRRWRGGAEAQNQIALGDHPFVRAWETLLREIRPKGIRRLDLRLASGPIEGCRQWVDPLAKTGASLVDIGLGATA
jgi:hypothetical protein